MRKMSKKWKFISFIYRFVAKYLRKWDQKYVKFDKVYFNSKYTKKLACEIYWWKNDWWQKNIVYPIVEIPSFQTIDIVNKYNDLKNKQYYIYIWRLVKYVKHVDVIIDSFNKSWKQLVIVWTWPDEKYLKSIAKKNILFTWYLSTKEDLYWSLLKQSNALINITKESFGIVTMQALKMQIPVIGYNKWATPELEWEKILIKEQTENMLTLACNKL